MNVRLDPHITSAVVRGIGRARRCLALLAALFLLAATPIARAAESAPLASLSSVLLVDASGQGTTLIISGSLAGQTPLPQVLELPVPSGARPSWVGEISGGDPSTDPTATYSIRRARGYDIVTLSLEKYLRGQVEITQPAQSRASAGQDRAGTPYALELPILDAVGSASLEFDVPAGSVVSSLSAGLAKGASSSSADQYVLSRSLPAAGSILRAGLVMAPPLTGSPQQPAPAGQAAPTSQGSSKPLGSSIQWLLLLASVVFFAYNAYRFSQTRAARNAADAAVGGGGAARSADVGAVPRPSHKSDRRAELPASERERRGAATERELKLLQDRRARGEMTRHEFLAAKTAILAGKQRTSASS